MESAFATARKEWDSVAMSNTSCDELNREDLAQCAAIIDETELFRDYGTTGQAITKLLEKALSDPSSDLLALRTGTGLAGFAWVLRNGAFGRSAYLRLIAVSSVSRGHGYGSRLLAGIEAKHLLPHGLFLLTTETNTGARRFYETSGYGLLGIIPGYVKPGLNECIYYKAYKAQALTR